MSRWSGGITDADLNLALDRFLRSGADDGADRVAEAAMLAVAVTDQRGRRGGRWQRRTMRVAGAWAATLLVLAVAGYGAWRSANPVVEPTATPDASATEAPSPSAAPTTTPQPTTAFVFPADGYRLTLRGSWQAEPGQVDTQRRFLTFDEPGGQLQVTVGGADGTIEACIGPGPCRTILASSLDAFGEALFPGPRGIFVQGPTEVSLDGEQAQRYSVANLDVPGESTWYVLALHGTRPIVLSFAATPGKGNLSIDEVLDGFRFVEVVTFVNPDGGYAISLPDTWTEWEPGVFNSAEDPKPTVRIAAGTPDGRLAACRFFSYSFFEPSPPQACPEHVFADAGQMADALLPQAPCFLCPYATRAFDVTVGGEDAAVYRITTLDGATYAAFVLHGGRPYAIWTTPTSVTLGSDALDAAVARLMREALAGVTWLD